MKITKCEMCGKEILSLNRTRKYCPDCVEVRCRERSRVKMQKKAAARPLRAQRCELCGKVFATKDLRRHYCDNCKGMKKEDRDRLRREKEAAKASAVQYCAYCGAIVKPYPQNEGKKLVFCGNPKSTIKEDDCVMGYWRRLHEKYGRK